MSVFLEIEGIKGESSDQGHKDWIDLESWGWEVERGMTSASSTRGDRESSNAKISSLIATKRIDSATPKIFIDSCCGTGKTIKLHLTKTGSGNGADVYMEFVLKNALIEKFALTGKKQDTKRPLEALSFSFIEIQVKYIPYDDKGNAMAPIVVGFDTATNTQL